MQRHVLDYGAATSVGRAYTTRGEYVTAELERLGIDKQPVMI